jgi:hypothetical protein
MVAERNAADRGGFVSRQQRNDLRQLVRCEEHF